MRNIEVFKNKLQFYLLNNKYTFKLKKIVFMFQLASRLTTT